MISNEEPPRVLHSRVAQVHRQIAHISSMDNPTTKDSFTTGSPPGVLLRTANKRHHFHLGDTMESVAGSLGKKLQENYPLPSAGITLTQKKPGDSEKVLTILPTPLREKSARKSKAYIEPKPFTLKKKKIKKVSPLARSAKQDSLHQTVPVTVDSKEKPNQLSPLSRVPLQQGFLNQHPRILRQKQLLKLQQHNRRSNDPPPPQGDKYLKSPRIKRMATEKEVKNVPGLRVKKLNLKHVELMRSQSTFSQSLQFKKPEWVRSRYFGKFKQVNLQVYDSQSNPRAASLGEDQVAEEQDSANIVVGRKLPVPGGEKAGVPRMNTLAVSNRIQDFKRQLSCKKSSLASQEFQICPMPASTNPKNSPVAQALDEPALQQHSLLRPTNNRLTNISESSTNQAIDTTQEFRRHSPHYGNEPVQATTLYNTQNSNFRMTDPYQLKQPSSGDHTPQSRIGFGERRARLSPQANKDLEQSLRVSGLRFQSTMPADFSMTTTSQFKKNIKFQKKTLNLSSSQQKFAKLQNQDEYEAVKSILFPTDLETAVQAQLEAVKQEPILPNINSTLKIEGFNSVGEMSAETKRRFNVKIFQGDNANFILLNQIEEAIKETTPQAKEGIFGDYYNYTKSHPGEGDTSREIRRTEIAGQTLQTPGIRSSHSNQRTLITSHDETNITKLKAVPPSNQQFSSVIQSNNLHAILDDEDIHASPPRIEHDLDPNNFLTLQQPEERKSDRSEGATSDTFNFKNTRKRKKKTEKSETTAQNSKPLLGLDPYLDQYTFDSKPKLTGGDVKAGAILITKSNLDVDGVVEGDHSSQQINRRCFSSKKCQELSPANSARSGKKAVLSKSSRYSHYTIENGGANHLAVVSPQNRMGELSASFSSHLVGSSFQHPGDLEPQPSVPSPLLPHQAKISLNLSKPSLTKFEEYLQDEQTKRDKEAVIQSPRIITVPTTILNSGRKLLPKTNKKIERIIRQTLSSSKGKVSPDQLYRKMSTVKDNEASVTSLQRPRRSKPRPVNNTKF